MSIEVMLPFYGNPALLKEAVDSVLAQDSPDWRLTVVDDAYPDPEAAAWIGHLADERVTLLRNAENLGVSRMFQLCLDLAREDWVVILGYDDRLLPHYVSRMLAVTASHPTAAYVQPGVRVIDSEGRPTWPLVDRVKAHYRPDVQAPTLMPSRSLAESLLRGDWAYFPSICWRRDLVARYGFDSRYETVLDWWLQLSMLMDGERMVLDPEVTFEYRRHAAAASSVAAVDVSRFHEEKALLLQMRDIAARQGWRRGRRIATLHLSSRLHALTTWLGRALTGHLSGSSALLGHALTNRLPPGAPTSRPGEPETP